MGQGSLVCMLWQPGLPGVQCSAQWPSCSWLLVCTLTCSVVPDGASGHWRMCLSHAYHSRPPTVYLTCLSFLCPGVSGVSHSHSTLPAASPHPPLTTPHQTLISDYGGILTPLVSCSVSWLHQASDTTLAVSCCLV